MHLVKRTPFTPATTSRGHRGYTPPIFTAQEAAIETALREAQKMDAGADAVEQAILRWMAGLKLGCDLAQQDFLNNCMRTVTSGLSMKTSPVFIVAKLKEDYGKSRLH